MPLELFSPSPSTLSPISVTTSPSGVGSSSETFTTISEKSFEANSSNLRNTPPATNSALATKTKNHYFSPISSFPDYPAINLTFYNRSDQFFPHYNSRIPATSSQIRSSIRFHHPSSRFMYEASHISVQLLSHRHTDSLRKYSLSYKQHSPINNFMINKY